MPLVTTKWHVQVAMHMRALRSTLRRTTTGGDILRQIACSANCAMRRKEIVNAKTEDAILNQIRAAIAKAYANYLPQDPASARWPLADDVAKFHWDVFGQFGLPPSTFGGTPLGAWGGLVLPGYWCPICGGYGTGVGMH
jgi:hypothetical protein